MTAETRSLHRKLAQIIYEAERIPKRGTAPAAMGGYPFVQVGDAADYIRKALGEAVLTMMPTKIEVIGQVDRPTKSGGTMTTLDLRVEWTITDGESGESITIESFGAGADGGDKYSGKAMTSAMKYAFLAGFLLSTGDDTEASAVEHVQRTPAEQNAVERERLAANAPTLPADGTKGGPPPTKPLLINGDGSLIGTAELSKDSPDFLPHVGPDGAVLTFKLVSPAGGIKVIAKGDMAYVLSSLREGVIGQRVSCWGKIRDETFTKPATGKTKAFTQTYQVLDLERIKGPEFILPAEEAETVPLFEGPLFDGTPA